MKAVYTAIFGKKDTLHEPRIVPPGWDFVCFTDQPLSSRVWQVRRVAAPEKDSTRSARKYKILAHEFLSDYDVSLWVDGNILVRGDVEELASAYLSDAHLALGDHAQSRDMPLSSLESGLARLLWMEKIGKHQEDAALMQAQYNAYAKEGYPDVYGLAWTMLIMRKHNEPDVIAAMNAWWAEIEKWSKRDQMSFNYVAWKTGLKFKYLPFDPADNPYFRRLSHYLPLPRKLYSYWLGFLKRLKIKI